jgi:hypothetical protein
MPRTKLGERKGVAGWRQSGQWRKSQIPLNLRSPDATGFRMVPTAAGDGPKTCDNMDTEAHDRKKKGLRVFDVCLYPAEKGTEPFPFIEAHTIIDVRRLDGSGGFVLRLGGPPFDPEADFVGVCQCPTTGRIVFEWKDESWNWTSPW